MQKLQSIFLVFREKISLLLSSDRLKSVVSASESPAGFMAIAGLGLFLVALGQMGAFDSQPDTPTTPTLSVPDGATPKGEAIPKEVTTESSAVAGPENSPRTEILTLKRRETLIELLRRNNFSSRSAHAAVLSLGRVANMRRLRAGQTFSVRRSVNDASALDALWFREAFDKEAHVELTDGGGYAAKEVPVPTLSLTQLVEGTIDDNLYLAAKDAGLPDGVIIELIRMLSFDVDFEREIRQGDTFSVYYERRYAPTYGDTENGDILHVDLGLKRAPVAATLFEASDGTRDYFRPDGKSTRRTLMKTPLDVAVVTSSYGRRKHPVLGYTRMHKGVDFRAPTGTPIMAAGDGVIEMAERYGSYGNYIRIRHNDSYKTAYAHLSKYARGIKKGQRVKQGQVIGYSGATGRVTAAHLHYEVLRNGKQTNPLTLKLPTGKTLKGDDLERFQERHALLIADINTVREQGAVLLAEQQGPEITLAGGTTTARQARR